jgi:ribosomal-protein-alanine N-acetyltransferase
MRIRTATRSDRYTICRLEMRCFHWSRAIAGLWQRVGNASTSAWIATDNDQPVAYLIAYPNKLDGESLPYIGGVGTLLEFRGKGIGRTLCEAMLEQHGAAWLHVRASNTPAIKMYESLGFDTLRTQTKFYGNGEDALIMIRRAKT